MGTSTISMAIFNSFLYIVTLEDTFQLLIGGFNFFFSFPSLFGMISLKWPMVACPYCRYPHHIPCRYPHHTWKQLHPDIVSMKNTYLIPSTATFLLVKIGLILLVEGLLKPWFPHSFLNLAAYYPLVVGRFPCFWLVIHVVNPRINVQLRKVYTTQEMGDVDGGIGFTT